MYQLHPPRASCCLELILTYFLWLFVRSLITFIKVLTDCWISSYFTVMRFSASEEVKKNLTGTVGGNITLPDSVQEGFLLYERKIIAHVINGEIKVYKNRLQWDRNSGLFTLTELQRDDSGSYVIDSKTGKGNRKSSYKLTVYGKSHIYSGIFLCNIPAPYVTSVCMFLISLVISSLQNKNSFLFL